MLEIIYRIASYLEVCDFAAITRQFRGAQQPSTGQYFFAYASKEPGDLRTASRSKKKVPKRLLLLELTHRGCRRRRALCKAFMTRFIHRDDGYSYDERRFLPTINGEGFRAVETRWPQEMLGLNFGEFAFRV